MHNIDLRKLNTRTDLAVELINKEKCKKIRKSKNVNITKIKIRKNQEKELNKRKGNYITVEFKDVTDYDNSKEVERNFSEELKGIMSAMGLKIGEDPFKDGKCSLRIGEIRIYSDADTDGSHIAGLILNFIAKYWPSMIKNHRLARVNTPIIKATNTKNKSEQYRFYYLNEYKEWEKTHQASKYAIEYYKGLGALDDKEYQEIVQNPNIYYYELDDIYEEELDIWFGDDADKRKEKMSKTI